MNWPVIIAAIVGFHIPMVVTSILLVEYERRMVKFGWEQNEARQAIRAWIDRYPAQFNVVHVVAGIPCAGLFAWLTSLLT